MHELNAVWSKEAEFPILMNQTRFSGNSHRSKLPFSRGNKCCCVDKVGVECVDLRAILLKLTLGLLQQCIKCISFNDIALRHQGGLPRWADAVGQFRRRPGIFFRALPPTTGDRGFSRLGCGPTTSFATIPLTTRERYSKKSPGNVRHRENARLRIPLAAQKKRFLNRGERVPRPHSFLRPTFSLLFAHGYRRFFNDRRRGVAVASQKDFLHGAVGRSYRHSSFLFLRTNTCLLFSLASQRIRIHQKYRA